MIYLLNHNTSYKHSKFSARPWTLQQTAQLKCGSLSGAVVSSAGPMKWGVVGARRISSTGLFEYQSKELLCWRYELSFFNLHSFFLNILKALHTCWCFAKNNKNIVFVSADNPYDNGVWKITDVLTQQFTREFLPRVEPNIRPGSSIRRALPRLRNSNACLPTPLLWPAAERGSEHTIVPTKDCSNPCNVTTKTAPYFSTRALNKINLNRRHDETMNKNKKINTFISKPGSASSRRNYNTTLTELKNLTSRSSFVGSSHNTVGTRKSSKQHAQPEPKRTDTPYDKDTAYFTYHKCDGLLYKAASRRLCGGFSRAHVSFFSNSKSSFCGKFSHLSGRSDRQPIKPHNEIALQRNSFAAAGIKKHYQFDLNKSCLIKPMYRVVTTHLFQPGALKKQSGGFKKRIDDNDPVFTYQQYEGHKKKISKQNKKSSNKLLRTRLEQSESFLPFAYSLIPLNHNNAKNGITLRPYSFSAYCRAIHKKIMLRPKVKQNHGVSHQLIRKYYTSDFYGAIMHTQNANTTKRFAYSPYAQHADLVFFVNPDKNPGLASQVKKLGIPSIGIVSGLKWSTYRKQSSHSNLHDSVTYPIVGNGDNLIFVMMVVRIFVQLIQKADGSGWNNKTNMLRTEAAV